jgi:hypothetical protein
VAVQQTPKQAENETEGDEDIAMLIEACVETLLFDLGN